MKVEEIVEKFKGLKRKDGALPLANIVQIQKYVNATLEMDRDKLAYYYKINVEDLANSNIPYELLDEMVKEDWQLSEDKKILTKMF